MKAVAFIVLSLVTIISLNSCATWQGLKHDSKSAWKTTKKTIHDATAD